MSSKRKQKDEQVNADWRALGRLMSTMVAVFTSIRDTFSEMGIGVDFLRWLTGDGKQSFVDDFLKPLGERYLAVQKVVEKSEHVRVIDNHTLLVNFGASPNKPFDTAEVESHQGEGWVKAEYRKDEDNLYLSKPCPTPEDAEDADQKLVLHLEEGQKGGGGIKGHKLCDALTGKPILSANLLDALYDHLELIPEHWKVDEQGRTRYIFFWATIYRYPSDGRLFVRCLCWVGGGWCRYYRWLDNDWDDYNPAVLASST